MAEVRRRGDFPQEPIVPERCGEFGAEHLHRNLSTVLQVVSEIHGGHAARAEFALYAVAVGEGSGKAQVHGRFSER